MDPLALINMIRNLLILFCFCSCASLSKLDYEKEKKAILELNAHSREYHFKKNALAMSDMSSDSFLVVNGGKISRPQREDQLKTFTNYFNSVDFVRWDDLNEPIIRFSRDASVAYVAVEKIVILKQLNTSNKEVLDTSYFAWISIYKKDRSGWKLDAIASTRKL